MGGHQSQVRVLASASSLLSPASVGPRPSTVGRHGTQVATRPPGDSSAGARWVRTPTQGVSDIGYWISDIGYAFRRGEIRGDRAPTRSTGPGYRRPDARVAASEDVYDAVQVHGGDVTLPVQPRSVHDIDDGRRPGGLLGGTLRDDDVDAITDARSRETEINERVVGDRPRAVRRRHRQGRVDVGNQLAPRRVREAAEADGPLPLEALVGDVVGGLDDQEQRSGPESLDQSLGDTCLVGSAVPLPTGRIANEQGQGFLRGRSLIS